MQKYIECGALFDGLSLDTPLYIVTEGNEPSFLTRYFAWDDSKAVVSSIRRAMLYYLSIETLVELSSILITW